MCKQCYSVDTVVKSSTITLSVCLSFSAMPMFFKMKANIEIKMIEQRKQKWVLHERARRPARRMSMDEGVERSHV